MAASFYARPAETVARELLGTVILSTIGGDLVAARIVETEAYVGSEDEASHAAARIGRTPRNEAMFGPAGIAYVYLIYGVHWCLNAVATEPGHPAAVLIRAASVLQGLQVTRRRRGRVPAEALLRGPGNLCRALGVTGLMNAHRLSEAPLCFLPGPSVSDAEVVRGPRVGITRSVDLPLRFCIRGDPAVSRRQ
ncbi:MAG: DNA-3-methyladenine glycosylase [Gemmatimonas sp.]|nr:DNA-3-methyladenine glycosylase [Gemmatimonas sp.]